MDGETTGRVAIGEVVGILKPWNPLSKKAKVLVKAEDDVIAIFVDVRQLDYARKKYSEKSRVVLGFYGGEWHLGVPAAPGGHTGETDIPAHEMDRYGLSGPGGDGENDAALDDILVHREYIRQVETDIKEHGDEILGRMGLSHMKNLHGREESVPPMKGDKLDRVVSQNDEILSYQKEMLWLLKKQIFPHENKGRSKGKFN